MKRFWAITFFDQYLLLKNIIREVRTSNAWYIDGVCEGRLCLYIDIQS